MADRTPPCSPPSRNLSSSYGVGWGGTVKYWMRVVMLPFPGKDDDSSDELSTLVNGSIIRVWSQHSLET